MNNCNRMKVSQIVLSMTSAIQLYNEMIKYCLGQSLGGPKANLIASLQHKISIQAYDALSYALIY